MASPFSSPASVGRTPWSCQAIGSPWAGGISTGARAAGADPLDAATGASGETGHPVAIGPAATAGATVAARSIRGIRRQKKPQEMDERVEARHVMAGRAGRVACRARRSVRNHAKPCLYAHQKLRRRPHRRSANHSSRFYSRRRACGCARLSPFSNYRRSRRRSSAA